MPTDTKTAPPAPAETTPGLDAARSGDHNGADAYVLPVVHVRMPETWVTGGFWGVLAGATLLGAVDPPLAVLIGAGVVVARHRASR
jgi:hypothetical protein